MGYDISYHPISEKEMYLWYVQPVEAAAKDDFAAAEQHAAEHEVHEFYQQKYKDTLKTGAETTHEETFDKSHGYYIANVQGFFRKYFYTRGSAFSFLIDSKPYFKKYTKNWQDTLPGQYKNAAINSITENYSSGVYLPYESVEQLYQDYQSSAQIRNDLDSFFSHGRIAIFQEALAFCREHQLGLLEASEVVEPNPLDLNQSVCYSNLFNCDVAGALLYQETAMQQIAEIEQQQGKPEGSIAKNASYTKTVTPPPIIESEKKSFWKKIFGK